MAEVTVSDARHPRNRRASPAADENVAGNLDKRQDGSKNKQISESIILIAQAYVPVVAVTRAPRVFALQVVA
jgi:hypothetical protein